MMKRILSMLLAFTFIISLTACMDDRHGKGGRGCRGTESLRSYVLGEVDELLQGTGRGNYFHGTDL